MPMRVDGDLFEAAKSIGAIASRSAAQQLNHWARIGRELENSPGTSARDIQRVLAGEPGITYDNLSEHDQAVVRASWDEAIEEKRSKLNYAKRFASEGSSWSGLDESGNVVIYNADKASNG